MGDVHQMPVQPIWIQQMMHQAENPEDRFKAGWVGHKVVPKLPQQDGHTNWPAWAGPCLRIVTPESLKLFLNPCKQM